MNKKHLILLIILTSLIALIANTPPDKKGVILATIESTIPTDTHETIIISTKNIDSYPNQTINNTTITFLNLAQIQQIADTQGPTPYHEFTQIQYILYGYRVSIDHLIMYPKDSTEPCYACSGDTGIAKYRNGEWVFQLTGGWVT